jgi:hypothetical protein
MMKEENQKGYSILLGVLALATVSAGIIVFSNSSPPAYAQIQSNLRIHWLNGTEVDSVDWGLLYPGASKHIDVLVQNLEEYPVDLELSISDWTPSYASEYFTLLSTPEKVVLGPNMTAEVRLTLSTQAENNLTDFSFTTIITGVECVGISGFIPLFKENPDTIMVYPSDNPEKPLERSPAMVSDWTASAFISTKIDGFTEAQDSDEGLVNSDGSLNCAPGCSLVTFGGPIVNVLVYYYESKGIAPIAHSTVPGSAGTEEPWSQWYLADGTSIPETDFEPDEHNDLFLLEVFKDEEDRNVLIAYGITWKGSYAAGKYFEAEIYPRLDEYPYEWIIVKWHDANQDGFVNGPDNGDNYTLISSSG